MHVINVPWCPLNYINFPSLPSVPHFFTILLSHCPCGLPRPSRPPFAPTSAIHLFIVTEITPSHHQWIPDYQIIKILFWQVLTLFDLFITSNRICAFLLSLSLSSEALQPPFFHCFPLLPSRPFLLFLSFRLPLKLGLWLGSLPWYLKNEVIPTPCLSPIASNSHSGCF